MGFFCDCLLVFSLLLNILFASYYVYASNLLENYINTEAIHARINTITESIIEQRIPPETDALILLSAIFLFLKTGTLSLFLQDTLALPECSQLLILM